MRKIHGVLAFIVLFTAIIAGTSFAGNREAAVSLSPHLGGYVFEGNQDINNDPVYGVGVGVNITERIAVEGVFDWVDTETNGSSHKRDVEAEIYRLDGLYHFYPEANKDLVPFLSIGGGAINLESEQGESDTDLLVDYGGGFKYFITNSLAVRAEVRHIIDVEDDVHNNLIYTLGLNFLIGGREKEVVPPPVPAPSDSDGDGVNDDADKCPGTPRGVTVDMSGCPLDSDKDGVYDYLDKCPGTPAGVAVDKVGCPLDSDGDGVFDYKDKCPGTPMGTPVDSNGCPLDSDGDGVYDIMDKCPDTPKGAPVDKVGCPLDSDGDGVFDYLDKCPDTPKGIQVDMKGCPVPIKEKVTIELNVEFELNSPVVKNMYHDHIEKVANFLKAYPDTEAVIEGHTDSSGSDAYNMKLSQKRAENVKQHLIDNGVDPNRLKAVGYGESRPIADNKTEEGRQKNRRVIAVISTVVTK